MSMAIAQMAFEFDSTSSCEVLHDRRQVMVCALSLLLLCVNVVCICNNVDKPAHLVFYIMPVTEAAAGQHPGDA